MMAGYHTAGLLLHDPVTAIVELAHLGYQCVAIRPHAAWFHPELPGFGTQLLRIADVINRTGVRLVIDLDALFVRDPFVARGPSLVAADDQQCDDARAWIARWIRIADEAGADVLTFSTGVGSGSELAEDQEDLERLTGQLSKLLADASDHRVQLALRPRSGDAIASVAQFERLGRWLGESSGDAIGLAADVGEMLSAGELPLGDRLVRNLDSLRCVYLCDRQSGVAGDKPIGRGDVALHRLIETLRRGGYNGPAIIRVEGHVELGLTAASEAIAVFE